MSGEIPTCIRSIQAGIMLARVVLGSAFSWCGKHRLCFWDGSFCIKKNLVIFRLFGNSRGIPPYLGPNPYVGINPDIRVGVYHGDSQRAV